MTAGAATMVVRMLAAWSFWSVEMGVPATAADPATLLPKQEVVMSDRIPLAQLVEPLNAELARIIRDKDTEVHRLDTPFLLQGLIFRVDWYGPNTPFSMTVGYARRDNHVVLLAANKPGFDELVAKAVLTLDSEEQRIALAVTELEVTRRFEETFVVLRSFGDLRPVPTPTAEEEERIRAIRRKYEPLIQLPRAAGNGPWTMPIYVLSQDELCLFTVTLDVAGGTTIVKTVLEAHTPLLPATS
jgi:hypothetical protein